MVYWAKGSITLNEKDAVMTSIGSSGGFGGASNLGSVVNPRQMLVSFNDGLLVYFPNPWESGHYCRASIGSREKQSYRFG